MSMSGVNRMRMGGLATGIDTDQVVRDTLRMDRMRIDIFKQKKQLAEWKRDSYRDFTNVLRGIKGEFMDILRPSTNMLSSSSYKSFKTTATNSSNQPSSVVSVTGSTDAAVGNYTIEVKEMATPDVAKSMETVSKPLEGGVITFDATNTLASFEGKKFTLTLAGTTKEITISDPALMAGTDHEKLAKAIEKGIETAFGAGKVTVSTAGGKLTFASEGTAGRVTVSSSANNDALTSMQFMSGATDRISASSNLGILSKGLDTPMTFVGNTTQITSAQTITNTDWAGKSFTLEVDGVAHEIMGEASWNGNILTGIQSAIAANGALSGKIEVTETEGKLSFQGIGGTNVIKFIGNSEEESDALRHLHIASGKSAGSEVKFTINTKEFTFTADQTLNAVMSAINANSDANATMRYDEITDQFTLTSKSLGAGKNLTVQDGQGGFLTAIKMFDGIDLNVTTKGGDSSVLINDVLIKRTTNLIEHEGISYTLLQKSPEVQKVTVSINSDEVFDRIKNFIDKYNALVEKLDSKLTERKSRGFQPLTDEQRDTMNEKDIEKWEEKSKVGLFRNDDLLQKIMLDMRKTFFDGIDGVATTLKNIGIDTGHYSEKGKLNISEIKLKEAIQNDPDAIMNLFSKTSESQPRYSRTMGSLERQQRYNEQGIMHRLFDIIEDNISTFTDSSGRKGKLLERAGMPGDRSVSNNMIFKEIESYDKKTDSMWRNYYRKEEGLYKKFANLEKAMSQMQNQGSSLMAQMGMGGK
jgi:flagellar hook-associated protein 2